MEKVTLSWKTIIEDSRKLLNSLPKRKWKRLIIITRGGLVLGSIFSRWLNIRNIETFCVQSYLGQSSMRKVKIFSKDVCMSDSNFDLVVDDVVDQYKTYDVVREYYKEASFCSLYIKKSRDLKNFYYSRQFPQNTWLDFPWERFKF